MDIVLGVDHLPSCGETILSKSIGKATGGKGANQAVAAARLGAAVNMIGRVGNDEFGRTIKGALDSDDVGNEFVLVDMDKPTGTAYILVDENGNNSIIVDSGANMAITNEQINSASKVFNNARIIISQFETPMEITINAFKKARESGILTILNPAPAREIPQELFRYTDIIIPNETEAELLTGVKIDSTEAAENAAKIFLSKGCTYAVITLGDRGAFAASKDSVKSVQAFKVEAVDTTAAGDAFIGAFATKLSGYERIDFNNIIEAVKFGNLVSSIVVQRHGAQPSLPYKEEITKYSKGLIE